MASYPDSAASLLGDLSMYIHLSEFQVSAVIKLHEPHTAAFPLD